MLDSRSMMGGRRLWLVVVVLSVVGAWTPVVSANSTGASLPLPNPRHFRIPARNFPWHTDFLLDARVENNAQATQDGIILYDPSAGDLPTWNALHRVTGWYEDALMNRGRMQPAVDILVSEFRTVAAAQKAHNAEISNNSTEPVASRPHLGSESIEFSSGGIITESGKKILVEDSIILTRYQNLELDVAVYDSHSPKYTWRAQLRVAAKALATRLAKIARQVLPPPATPTPTSTPTATVAPTSTLTPVATSTPTATPTPTR